ncbi:MAG: hypothetical protein ACTSV1_08415 [Alphaproteobacteria bacterium]
MPRLVIVDPGLRNKSGHHYNFDLSLIEEANRHQMPHTILAHLHPEDRDLLRVLRTTSAFKWDQYVAPYMDTYQSEGPARTAVKLNNQYFSEFQKFLPAVVEDGDLVVFHSMTAGLVEAVGRWMHETARALNTHTVVMFMSGDYLDYPEGTENELAEFYKKFFEHISGLDPARYTLWAENSEIVSDLKKLTDKDFDISVTPHCKPSGILRKLRNALPDPSTRPDVLNIGYFGQSAYARGSHLIPAAVHKIAEKTPRPVHFNIQMNLAYYYTWDKQAPNMEADIETLRGIDNITLTEGQVEVDPYYKNIATTDIMLLPYGEHYLRQGSGVFFESLALGKTMVIPANSFMSHFIHDIDGVAAEIKTFDSDGIANAALEAIEKFEEMQPIARRSGFQWQDDFDLAKHFDILMEKAAAHG